MHTSAYEQFLLITLLIINNQVTLAYGAKI